MLIDTVNLKLNFLLAVRGDIYAAETFMNDVYTILPIIEVAVAPILFG